MDTKQCAALVDKAATKLAKDKLIESLRKIADKDIPILQDKTSNFTIIKVKLS